MRLRYWLTGAVVLSIAAACALDDVDFSNKQCPCGEGYVCDPVKAICVPPNEVTPIATNDAGPIGDGSVIGCTGESCPCNVDSDCKELGRSRCSPNKVCVECLPESDNCQGPSYCTADFTCLPGCKSNADCVISPLSPKCNTTSHQCVECVGSGDCAGAKPLCSPSGICVEGCDLDAGKGCDGGACCSGFCVNTNTDKLNCGGCGSVCSTVFNTPSCNNKSCSYQCATGKAHCQSGNTGCETDTRTATSCGSCGNLKNCTQIVQNAMNIGCSSSGNCSYTCLPNFMSADGDVNNGCETPCGTRDVRCCNGGPTGVGGTCNVGLFCNGAGVCK